MSEQLKLDACKFCGGKPRIAMNETGDWAKITCTKCGFNLHGALDEYFDVERVVKMWSEVTLEDELREAKNSIYPMLDQFEDKIDSVAYQKRELVSALRLLSYLVQQTLVTYGTATDVFTGFLGAAQGACETLEKFGVLVPAIAETELVNEYDWGGVGVFEAAINESK